MAIGINNYSNNYNSIYSGLSSLYSPSKVSSSVSSFLEGLESAKNRSSSWLSNSGINSSMQSYAAGLREGSATLRSALKDLMSRSPVDSAFKQKTVSSSNADSVTGAISSSYYGNAKDVTLSVEQIATGQVNKGASLNSSASAEESGYKQFAIDAGGKSYQFSFEMTSADTAQTMQQKMADAINSRDIGISASLTRDGDNTTLTVQSKTTGAGDKNGFSIRDVMGGTVAKTGVSTISEAGQDAIFNVNGVKRTSASNEVDLGTGITATLKAKTTSDVTLSVKSDPKAATDKVQSMVDGYNKLLASIDENKGVDTSVGGKSLRRQLTGLVKTYARSLSNVGIETSSTGYLSVNSSKLNKAIDSSDLQRMFSGSGSRTSGFAASLDRLSSDVQRFPTKYMNDVLPNTIYTQNLSKSTSSYLNYSSIGLLMDFML